MALLDVTNVTPHSKRNKKRLSDGTFKEYEYQTYRKQLELLFKSESEKISFESKLLEVKGLIGGKPPMKDILIKLVDFYLSVNRSTSQQCSTPGVSQTETERSSFKDETLYIGDVDSVEKYAALISEHSKTCVGNLSIVHISKKGHVLILKYKCSNGHEVTWASSSACGDDYQVNYKVLASYICSGITATQYEKLCEFATFNIPTRTFRARAITYLSTIIELLRKSSITTARREEMEASSKQGEVGISIMTDARHACRKNAYHSDHVALGQKVHKVIDVQHITKRIERSSQKHEDLGCRKMYEDFDRAGIQVKDHAHDRNTSVNKQVKQRADTSNSNERWHATKPIRAGFRKIAQGPQKNKGVTWHPELSDKGSKFRNHVYYSMENCLGDANTLRELLDSSVLHFQNNHRTCPNVSPCKEPGYIPDFVIIRSQEAVRLLEKFIHSLTVYKSAEDYVLARDTFYIESYNNACLMYLDKRIHYQDKMYELRRDLCVLDWNEHVDRPYTSSYKRLRADHMGRRSGKKRYKKKTYNFVKDIMLHLLDIGEGQHRLHVESDIEEELDDGHQTCSNHSGSDDDDISDDD